MLCSETARGKKKTLSCGIQHICKLGAPGERNAQSVYMLQSLSPLLTWTLQFLFQQPEETRH